MKKRVFVLAAVLALIAAMFTLSAFAADPNAGYTEIGTADEFVTLMKSSANWSKNYRLTDDIDLTGKGWNQTIGDLSTAFTGIFDGNGKTIKGLSLSMARVCVGLFGTTRDAEIRNLTVEGTVKVTGKNFTGGLIGAVCGETLVEGCTSNVEVTGVSRVGGMIGGLILNSTKGTYPADSKDYTVIIRNCTNKGEVSSTATGEARTGGLIGSGSIGGDFDRHFVIEDCRNEGTVNVKGDYAGGIIGYSDPRKGHQTVKISNCTNAASGTVTGPKSGIGGIIGYIANFSVDFTISGCTNEAAINGTGSAAQRVGGIVGFASLAKQSDLPKLTLSGCVNTGEIRAVKSAGGIAGFLDPTNNTSYTEDYAIAVRDCKNSGAVTVTVASYAQVGGVVGVVAASSSSRKLNGAWVLISGCTNTGAVSAPAASVSSRIGGILGFANVAADQSASLDIYDCTNEGEVSTIGSNAGGVIGLYDASSAKDGALTVARCINRGAITAGVDTAASANGAVNAAGIVGNLSSALPVNLSSLYNAGDVSATGKYIGGIVGRFYAKSNDSRLIDSFNTGKITGANGVIGGIVGSSRLSDAAIVFDKLYNKGMVVSSTAYYVGGVAGTIAAASEEIMTNCYYSQNISCTKEGDRYTTETKVTPASTIADNEQVFAGLVPRYLEDGWIILPDGPMLLFMHTHTYDSDGVCTECGRKDAATCEHKGGRHIGIVSAVADCMNEGKYQVICNDCWTVVDEVDAPKDLNNHKLEWVVVNGELVCKCVNRDKDGNNCPYVATTNPGSASEVYVADAGFKAGGFSAEAPINDYYKALELALLAARRDGRTTATVYVVGQVTIPLNRKGTFLEPAHEDVEITIKGYGKSAASFVFGDAGAQRLEYGLNGPTVFANLEISSGNNRSSLYLVARHNHLTVMGDVTSDFRRNAGGTEFHSGNLTLLGGCYSSNFGDCKGKDAHLTVYGGTYRNIITGSANRSCGLANGKCTLELLGNVTTRESIFGGSSNGAAGNVDIFVNGDVAASKFFSFGGSNDQTVKDVRVYLYGGSISSGSFASALTPAPIGCASAEDSILAGKKSLTVYYDPSVPSSKEMMRLIKTSANDGDKVAFALLDSVCTASPDGLHAHEAGAAPIETAEATCFTDGYEIYECRYCHKNYTVSTGRAAHQFVAAPELNKAATCKSAGMTAEVCTICGFTKYTVDESQPADPNAHVLGEDGVCTVCRYSAAADCEHDFGDVQTEKTQCGTTTYRVCSKCKLRETISTTGSHNWGKYTVTVEATDTAPGIKTRKCKTCGKVETALLYPNDSTLATDPIAVDASGNTVGFSIENSKLTKAEKEALNALLQDTAYGSEVKVSYTTDGTVVTNVTYSIPVPDAYKDYENVKVIVKDDEGNLHAVDFKIEKGYIVFTF